MMEQSPEGAASSRMERERESEQRRREKAPATEGSGRDSGFCIVSMATPPDVLSNYHLVLPHAPLCRHSCRPSPLHTMLILRLPKRPKKDSTKRDTKRWSLLQAFLTTRGTVCGSLSLFVLHARVSTYTHRCVPRAEGRRGTFNSLFRRMKNSGSPRA